MSGAPDLLERAVEQAFAGLRQARQQHEPGLVPRETGALKVVSAGVARVTGLPGIGFEELVRFPGDVFGIAFDLDEDDVGVVLLGDHASLHAGDEVERTGRVTDVPVGDALLGRVIDPLGRPLDGLGPVAASKRLPIERPAPHIMDRAPVTVPLQTGWKVIDALVPVGRGQRELILGDRQTGKSAIAIDAVLNQRDSGVLCVYCAVGQRASAVAKAIALFRDAGAMEHTVVVVTEGNQAPGLSYIAPYAATSIAEHFMEAGRDVLIVYDDLTQHARAYRELSLLLRRPPGREAFPGDIFYIHSRLLERSTRLRPELGGGSLTALPIIETEAQNMSAYIPTNLISITDGQIVLSPTLFELGVLPAVDVGMSVSRVGGKAQRSAYRAVAGDLKLAYAQFEELETFARFGARLDEATRRTIEHGRRIRACLNQAESDPVTVPAQIAILLALNEGLFDQVPLERMPEAERAVREAAAGMRPDAGARIETASELGAQDRAAMVELARGALALPAEGAGLSDTMEGLGHQIGSATDLQSVVRTMKALALSSIAQYERSVSALTDYYRTVELGLGACLRSVEPSTQASQATRTGSQGVKRPVRAVVFGSDQGLVGRFNEVVADHAVASLGRLSEAPRVWAVGERVHAQLADAGLRPVDRYAVPTSVNAIAPLVGRILLDTQRDRRHGEELELHLYYNSPGPGSTYESAESRLLPLDDEWRLQRAALTWPTANLPEVMGERSLTLAGLVGEYLFVSLFRACAESLASENASRLAAMERADKNIGELLAGLGGRFHQLRQSRIDEELFDLIAGFDALQSGTVKHHRWMASEGPD